MGGTISAEEDNRWLEEEKLKPYRERIRQLEQLNATLSAEIDRSRPIVDAAVAYLKYDGNDRMQLIRLRAAINNAAFNYEASKPK